MLKEFEEFVTKATWATDKYWYPALGLAGETGEVVDEVKKFFRDDKQTLTERRREKIKLEMGDVLHYFIRLAKDFDISLDEIMQGNIDKLNARVKRNNG